MRESFWFGMMKKREVAVPTFKGLLVLAALAAAFGRFLLTHVQPFLAVDHPINGEVMVVEGWIPDYAMREALVAFRSHPYKLLITTGGPLPQGMVFSSYGTYAHFAAMTFKGLGMPEDSLAEVPSPDVGRDRTYEEAMSLREWMRAHGKAFASVDLVSFSSHARRSRLLYRLALGEKIAVGVYAPHDGGYDPAAWWRTSNGVRRVSDEVLAYLYAKLWFRARP